MSKCIKCGRKLTLGETLEIYSGMCGKCYEEQYDKFIKKIDGKYLFGAIEKPLRQQIDQLKQQLEEKDKEIASLQVLIIENKNDIKEMREFKTGDNEYDLTDEDARNDIKNQLENQTQLAIQELEKVKENLKQLEINIDNQAGFSQGYKLELKQKSLYKNVYKTIDQQIKELKGEKDVED